MRHLLVGNTVNDQTVELKVGLLNWCLKMLNHLSDRIKLKLWMLLTLLLFGFKHIFHLYQDDY